MARPKKIENAENAEVETEVIETEKAELEKTENTEKTSNEPAVELSEMLKIIEEQKKVIENQSKALEQLLNQKVEKVETATEENNSVMVELLKSLNANAKRDVVRVIHLQNVAQAIFKLSNGNKIKFNHYGEIQPMSIIDAELLLNQYKETFARGALTFDADHLHMIEECGIDTSKINYHPMESIKEVAEMDDDEIENLIVNFQPFQREMLKSYILEELAKDKNAISYEKIKLINKIQKRIYKSKQGGYELIMDKLETLGVEE